MFIYYLYFFLLELLLLLHKSSLLIFFVLSSVSFECVLAKFSLTFKLTSTGHAFLFLSSFSYLCSSNYYLSFSFRTFNVHNLKNLYFTINSFSSYSRFTFIYSYIHNTLIHIHGFKDCKQISFTVAFLLICFNFMVYNVLFC